MLGSKFGLVAERLLQLTHSINLCGFANASTRAIWTEQSLRYACEERLRVVPHQSINVTALLRALVLVSCTADFVKDKDKEENKYF